MDDCLSFFIAAVGTTTNSFWPVQGNVDYGKTFECLFLKACIFHSFVYSCVEFLASNMFNFFLKMHQRLLGV